MPKSIPMEKQIDINDALPNNRKLEDILDEYHVHSSAVKGYARKLFPQKSHLQASRHAIVSNAMRHYVVSQHTLNMIHIQFIRNQSSECFTKIYYNLFSIIRS
jgi:hypothetical protein